VSKPKKMNFMQKVAEIRKRLLPKEGPKVPVGMKIIAKKKENK